MPFALGISLEAGDPNLRSNDVHVIDPATRKVVDRFRVGHRPQHVVPSYDLTTLWVTNNAEGRTDGSLTPIDPTTARWLLCLVVRELVGLA